MQLGEVTGKLDEANRNLSDFDASKKKLAAENGELQRQLEDAESQVNQLTKLKSSLQSQLEEAKRTADEESRVWILIFRLNLVLIENSLNFCSLGTCFRHVETP